MPVKGISESMRNTDILIDSISSIRAERAVTAALAIGAAYATLLTPIDTSTLINSQYRRVVVQGETVVGTVGYTAAYAAAVHNASGKLKGKPRAHFGKTKEGVEFGGGTGVGNYWDPNAEPQFLKKGFENNRAKIDAVMKKAFQL